MKPLFLYVLILISACWPVPGGAQNRQVTTEDLMRSLLAAGSDGERKALLLSEKEFVTAELRQAVMRQGNSYLTQGNYPLALDHYRLAQAVAEQIGDKRGIASAINNMGVIALYRGDFDL